MSLLLSKTALRKICYTNIDTASILQRVNDDKGNPYKLCELSKVISQVLGLFFSWCILDTWAACLIPQWVYHGADGGDNETEISTQWWSSIASISSALQCCCSVRESLVYYSVRTFRVIWPDFTSTFATTASFYC